MDDCDEGFYCPGKQNTSSPQNFICPAGHYCPKGSPDPIRCQNGTYEDRTGSWKCKICPSGHFCDNTISYVVLDNATTICPMGSYCPDGTSYKNEYLCPIGTFNNRTGLQEEAKCTTCLGGYYCPLPGMITPIDLCDAGYFCKQGAKSATPNQGLHANICPVGFYCPQGTNDPEPCPKGTYNNRTGLEKIQDCIDCPAGEYCQEISLIKTSGLCTAGYYCEINSNSSTRTICPAGSYCPDGSPSPTPCPRGTFSTTLGLANVTQCTQCTPGSYCNGTGLNGPTNICNEGFYCPGGNKEPNPTDTPCPIGLHCPSGSSAPVPCSPGTFANFSQAALCAECPAGFYCVPEEVVQGNSSTGHRLCPRGFYCPVGTGRNWTACPPGTFSNELGLEELNQCTQCTGGYYCDATNLTAPSGPCSPGYYCTSGVNVATPSSGHLGIGGECPTGHQCPGTTSVPENCAAGFYQDLTTQSSCKICPSGYFCVANSTTYTHQICPSGHYCPTGTRFNIQFPCPPGTFNNLTGQNNESACSPCTPGYYCENNGQSEVTGKCHAGFYCILGSHLAEPSLSAIGGRCSAGEYCPIGSSAPIGCDPGKYCDVAQMDAPRGPCSQGYYCVANSTTSQPTGVNGNQCTPGHYCPEGSFAETPCGPGFYLPSSGAWNISFCIKCTSGKFCNESGLASPKADCDRGFYCPEEQIVGNPNAYPCPKGYYCPPGSSVPIICPSGTYQDETQQWTCKDCPSGYYCDNSIEPIVNYTAYACPKGYYCPSNTNSSNEYPCPAGTFNNITTLRSASECLPCIGGFYCAGGAIEYPTTPCSPGYFCKSSAKTSTPTEGVNANICPVGKYCPEQTSEPIKCPAGTMSNASGNKNLTDCQPCTKGYYCEELGQITVTGPCIPGYYCLEASTVNNSIICPIGKYCPLATHTPINCPNGTWSNATNLKAESDCTPCPAGYYCQQNGLIEPEGLCREGYYCPISSNVPNPIVCPIGLHCPKGSPEPKSCLSGFYTNTTGMSVCVDCPPGYYCLPENVTAVNPVPGYHDCPMGYYCPNNTGLNWQPCPKGTFSREINLFRVEQCKDCSPGVYCDREAATNYTGPCSPGYYCEGGVDRSNPNNAEVNSTYPASCPLLGGHTGIGDVCPIGYHCPLGSALPVPCPSGYYQNEEGQSTCKNCPQGYYCTVNSTEFSDKPCPTGHYCPQNTKRGFEYPCPEGTFNTLEKQIDITACKNCTKGNYCMGIGLSIPTANCSEGWYCNERSTKPMPTNPDEGGECPAGTFCPGGSYVPTPCTPGNYCHIAGLHAPSGLCTQGYYCTLRASVPNPTDNTTGNICPMGYYCNIGSASPTPCEIGYYLDSTGNDVESDCKTCTEGKYCGSDALPQPTGNCSQGFYCPPGQKVSNPGNYTCPEGHFCLEGVAQPSPCPSGYYQVN